MEEYGRVVPQYLLPSPPLQEVARYDWMVSHIVEIVVETSNIHRVQLRYAYRSICAEYRLFSSTLLYFLTWRLPCELPLTRRHFSGVKGRSSKVFRIFPIAAASRSAIVGDLSGAAPAG
jgi:hypothetical protein